MSIEELKRRKGVYEAILAGMPTDSPDRESYQNDLARIESKIQALESEAPLPEKVEDAAVPSEPEAKAQGKELDVKEVPSTQNEELVLPPGKLEEKETAPATKPEGEVKEPVKAPEGAGVLAQVPTKKLVSDGVAIAKELVNRIVKHLKA